MDAPTTLALRGYRRPEVWSAGRGSSVRAASSTLRARSGACSRPGRSRPRGRSDGRRRAIGRRHVDQPIPLMAMGDGGARSTSAVSSRRARRNARSSSSSPPESMSATTRTCLELSQQQRSRDREQRDHIGAQLPAQHSPHDRHGKRNDDRDQDGGPENVCGVAMAGNAQHESHRQGETDGHGNDDGTHGNILRAHAPRASDLPPVGCVGTRSRVERPPRWSGRRALLRWRKRQEDSHEHHRQRPHLDLLRPLGGFAARNQEGRRSVPRPQDHRVARVEPGRRHRVCVRRLGTLPAYNDEELQKAALKSAMKAQLWPPRRASTHARRARNAPSTARPRKLSRWRTSMRPPSSAGRARPLAVQVVPARLRVAWRRAARTSPGAGHTAAGSGARAAAPAEQSATAIV